MLIEKLIFNMLAFSLFILVFAKLIKKNDTSYVVILALEALGITMDFIEIIVRARFGVIFTIIIYLLAIILPVLIIIIEAKGYNFTEIMYCMLSKLFSALGDKKAAKDILLKLVTKYPDSYKGHVMLAKLYEKEGGMRRAIDEYVLAIDCNTKDYDSYYKIAALLNDLGKKDEAIEMLENLIKNKPEYYEGSILLGDLLCEQERFKEAVSVYNEALKYKPADYDLYYNLGIAYTRLNDFASAKECYETAAEINHRMHMPRYYLGQIALLEKDLDEAEKYFVECLEDEALEAKAYYQLAKIAMVKGDKDKAIVFANKAIELDETYLKIIVKEDIFKPINKYIKVSAKMVDKPKKEISKRDEKIIEYLDDTYKLINNMNENEISARVDMIFKKQEEKRIREEAERNIELEESYINLQKEKDY